MGQRRFTIRISLVYLVSLSIILSAGTSMYLSYRGTRDSIHLLLNHTMIEIKNTFIEKASGYLTEATSSLHFIRELFENDVLRNDSLQNLSRFMRTILEQHPQFSSIYFANPTGNFWMLKRMPDRTYSMKIMLRRGGKTVTSWSHENPSWSAEFPDTVELASSAYDPPAQAWYARAAERKNMVWSGVYVFHEAREPGITCSIPLHRPGASTPSFVVGIDIGLDDLSYFLGDRALENVHVFVLNPGNRVIAAPLPRDHPPIRFLKDSGGASDFMTMDEFENGRFADIFRQFQLEADRNARVAPGSSGTFTFRANDEHFLGLRYSVRDISPWDWVIHIIVPEKIFMKDVYAKLKLTTGLCLALIAIALAAGYMISVKLSKPLSTLASDMENVRKFDLESKTHIGSRIVEINNIDEAFESMKIGLRSFKKYVPADLVRQLIRHNIEAEVGGEQRALTIYFSDLSDFMTLSERLAPEELVVILSEYLSHMSATILKYRGTVDKYIGDAVMAFWGAPEPTSNHAELACRSALENAQILSELNVRWVRDGKEPLRMRVGLNTGDAIVGNMGSPQRLNYTVIGDNVNLASRLEGINKFYGTNILISEETKFAAGDLFETRMIDYVRVKGKIRPVAVYELISDKGVIDAGRREAAGLYESGLEKYRARKWAGAIRAFEDVLKIRPDDAAAALFIDRCRQYADRPPPEDWTGESILTSK